MQHSFKVGDKVRQKDVDSIQTSDGSYLYKSKDLVDKILTVTAVDDDYVYFNKRKENVPHDVYCWERFELVEDKKQTQQTYKIGDKVKVVKLITFSCKEYESFVGQVFTVTGVLSRGVSTTSPNTSFSGLFFYDEEIELVEDTPVAKELTYKVGDCIEVKKIPHPCSEDPYDAVIGKKFSVCEVNSFGVLTSEGYYFYFDEIELTTPDTVSSRLTTIPDKKNHAWAVVNKDTGSVEFIRMTRKSARDVASYWNQARSRYQVKKIEFNFA